MPYKDRQKQLAAQKRLSKRHLNTIVEIVKASKSSGCLFCGESETACLDFHHVRPDEKDFDIGGHKRHSVERIVAEIAKCVVLCANCHRKLHAGLLSLDSLKQ